MIIKTSPRLRGLIFTLTALVAASVFTALPAPASAQDTPAAPATSAAKLDPFELVLRAMDTVPTRAQLDHRWPDAQQRLAAAASDAKRDLWTRSRAASLLSLYPNNATRDALGALLSDERLEVRRIAIYTLGRTFGAPGDAALVARVASFTRDPERRVREHAVRALRWIDHADADAALAKLADHTDKELADLARLTRERRTRRLAKRAK